MSAAVLVSVRDERPATSVHPLLCVAVTALSVAALSRPYHSLHRFVPLAAALVLGAFSGGLRVRAWQLVLVSLPLLTPFPAVLRSPIAPLRATAAGAGLTLRAFGVPASVDGTVLEIPGAALEVVEACAGLLPMSELVALALVASILFRAGLLRAIGAIAGAALISFLVNCARIAWLAIMLRSGEESFELWDGDGFYSPLVPLIATVLASGWLYAVLRSRPART